MKLFSATLLLLLAVTSTRAYEYEYEYENEYEYEYENENVIKEHKCSGFCGRGTSWNDERQECVPNILELLDLYNYARDEFNDMFNNMKFMMKNGELIAQVPTAQPTRKPTNKPTKFPTKAPTNFPTKAPTNAPTEFPTKAPTRKPTPKPTKAPTNFPTRAPTNAPTEYPTNAPTEYPTKAPTREPTRFPTKEPTAPTKCSDFTNPRHCKVYGKRGAWDDSGEIFARCEWNPFTNACQAGKVQMPTACQQITNLRMCFRGFNKGCMPCQINAGGAIFLSDKPMKSSQVDKLEEPPTKKDAAAAAWIKPVCENVALPKFQACSGTDCVCASKQCTGPFEAVGFCGKSVKKRKVRGARGRTVQTIITCWFKQNKYCM